LGKYLDKSPATGQAKFTTYKQRGEWVELLFMTRAAKRGFNVSKPWGDSARYDVSVEQDGRFKRVQTKCTDRWNGSSYSCGLYAAHQHAYTTRQIDYFAIYLIQDDIWYIFPAKTLIAQSAVILTPHRADSKHARYKEAWDLLDARKHTKSTPSDEPAPIVTRKPRKQRKYLRPTAE
jgi:hypothetical protein